MTQQTCDICNPKEKIPESGTMTACGKHSVDYVHQQTWEESIINPSKGFGDGEWKDIPTWQERFDEKFDKPLSDIVHKHLANPISRYTYYDNTEIKSFISQELNRQREEIKEIAESCKEEIETDGVTITTINYQRFIKQLK